jgi:hypothetical protein
MPNTQPLMRLSLDEELFVKHWLFEQFHYDSGPGPAKRLQIEHGGIPAELSILIAAAIPDPAQQKSAALGPPPIEPPSWPWTEQTFRTRVAQARATLAARRHDQPSCLVSAPR